MSTERPLSTADMAAAAVERKTDEHPDVAAARERGGTAQTPEHSRVQAPEGLRASTTDGTRAEPVQQRQPQEPLFAGSQAEDFRSRWGDIQTSFVDEPRRAVEQADALVAEVMQRLAQVFADERTKLEHQWDRGGETDTEALRQALRRYRSFFDRLLSM